MVLWAFFCLPTLALGQYKDAKSLLTAVTQKTGWSKWQTVQSVQVTSRIEYLKKDRTEVWALPNAYYSKSVSWYNVQSVEVVEVQTPQKSWRYEAKTKKTFPSEGLKTKVFPVQELNLLFDPAAALAPEATLNGKACYVITQPTRDKKFKHKFYFDKQTLLLYAVDWNYFDSAKDPQILEDYRQVNGFWFPFKEIISNKMTKETKQLVFNVKTEGLFTMPK